MLAKDLATAVEIKDPVHGYVGMTQIEKAILDLKMTQRLRRISYPACTQLVYPGAEMTAMSRMPGKMYVTQVLFENLGADTNDIQVARLASMLLTLAHGPWSNVMEEYLAVRGTDRRRLARLILEESEISEIVKGSSYSIEELKTSIERGFQIRGYRVDLLTIPINPHLVDSLMRDAYFAGVKYAPVEFPRLFTNSRILRDHLAVERGSLFTLESYLSAGANMFEALYYHKAVRAAELMLLRILDEAGSQIIKSPADDIGSFLECDDLSLYNTLLTAAPDASEEMSTACRLFQDYTRRYLIKMASTRAISDPEFLGKVATVDGQFEIEREIASEAGIDPMYVYIDFPDRVSVNYYPGKYPLDNLMLFERGSSGYELWPVLEMSSVARSLSRQMKTIRIYTTRGYRSKVKKSGDKVLESVDTKGVKLKDEKKRQ